MNVMTLSLAIVSQVSAFHSVFNENMFAEYLSLSVFIISMAGFTNRLIYRIKTSNK